ncbi:DnaD domain protein [Bengtsoniella intestinalis]|uniref:DnaD domain protein n=1 Tax=Bengtsoniella intestinalis TaxID=3073143 RepID=UPI00391F83B3
MASCLLHAADGGITLSPQATKRLLDRGDGDAALLYMALLRHGGQTLPRALAGELRWEKQRIEQAEATLIALQLLAQTKPEVPPEPAPERPQYQSQEIVQRLSQAGEFPSLVQAVEQVLGKKLTTPDVGILLGLHDYLGMPADVVYLLVGHCTQRVTQRYGQGRRPGMKQIEKEGYLWAKLGIETQQEATDYLLRYAQRQELVPQLMNALSLGERKPSPSEEKYFHAWQEMGFGADMVAVAYDRTILRCHELKWAYLNGILKRWNQDGIHTMEQLSKEAPKEKKQPTAAPPSDEMRRYVQQLHGKKEEGHGL